MSATQPPLGSEGVPVETNLQTPRAAAPVATNQAQIEYDRLTGYFKYLVTLTGIAIAILTGVATYLFSTNLNEAKKQAVDSAKVEAQKAVASTLEAPNIQKIIDDEVRTQTKVKVDAQIQATLGGKIDAFQKEQNQISAAVIHASLAQSLSAYGGGGSPEHLRQLDDLMYDSAYPSVRRIARDSIHQLALEYGKNSGSFNPPIYKPNALGYLSNQINGQTTLDLLNKSDTGMLEMYKAFVDLKTLTGWNVEAFDIRGANEWCSKHDCKLNTPTR